MQHIGNLHFLRQDKKTIHSVVEWVSDLVHLTSEQRSVLMDTMISRVLEIYCQALEPYGLVLTAGNGLLQYAKRRPLPPCESAERSQLIAVIDTAVHAAAAELREQISTLSEEDAS